MEREKGINNVSQIFTTLHTPFYVAHSKYMDFISKEELSGGSGRATLRSVSTYTKASDQDRKILIEKELNQQTLINLIVVIGKLTAYLDNPAVRVRFISFSII